MPPKIRNLIKELTKAGFVLVRQRGSHKHYQHRLGQRVTISGNPGDDAKRYQVLSVRKSIAGVINEEK